MPELTPEILAQAKAELERATASKKPFWKRPHFWITQLAGVGLCLIQAAPGGLTFEEVMICVTPFITTLASGGAMVAKRKGPG